MIPMTENSTTILVEALAAPIAAHVRKATEPLLLRILALEQQVTELKEKLRQQR